MTDPIQQAVADGERRALYEWQLTPPEQPIHVQAGWSGQLTKATTEGKRPR